MERLSPFQATRRARAAALVCNVAYAGALLAAAVLPRLPAGIRDVPDVWLHAGGYGLQAALLAWLLGAFGRRGPWALATAWLGATVFGGLTELLQSGTLERTAELSDVAADAAGAAGVCVLLAVAGRVRGGGRTVE